jgi:hypothetical protein
MERKTSTGISIPTVPREETSGVSPLRARRMWKMTAQVEVGRMWNDKSKKWCSAKNKIWTRHMSYVVRRPRSTPVLFGS